MKNERTESGTRVRNPRRRWHSRVAARDDVVGRSDSVARWSGRATRPATLLGNDSMRPRARRSLVWRPPLRELSRDAGRLRLSAMSLLRDDALLDAVSQVSPWRVESPPPMRIQT